jgi:hypothetical protein
MKSIRSHLSLKTTSLVACAAVALLGLLPHSHAANYAGNLNTGFGGPVGNGVLSVTDDRTNITVNLQRGSSGNLNDVLVIYIDTGTGTATNTAGFTSTGGTEQKAISGFDGGNRSVLTFANGFKPSYAVAIKGDFMDVWSLANPANFSFLAGTGQGGSGSANFALTFNCGLLGLVTNVPTSIKIFGTYISGGGYRSTEAIAGNLVTPFGQGYNPFTNTAYATYNFAPAVVPTYAVKFSVDMKAQADLGNFTPGTDAVYGGGSFQTNAFAFSDFPLVRSNTSTIYTNTYLVADPTNTVETYKFKYITALATNFDSDPNRSFTLKSGGQVLPLVYFDNVPASPSATTNYITFRIDMGPQIYLGHFTPGTDLIKVYGSFEQPHWSGNFDPTGVLNYLTNNPTLSGNASNIYSGTFADGNYPGTVTQYKYVIAPGGTGTTYEDGSDRTLVTPTNAATKAIEYFNGVSTYAAIPITFSVDMTVPIASGQLNPANGDTVGCAGTFQTNSFGVGVNGFTLTNNPTLSGLASNIYSGTYIDRNAPGSGERYKFVINPGGAGTTIYEQPASTGGGDRQFLLGSVAATNPLVLWGDRSPNDVVLVPTTVTFHVSMTNALDRWGVAFDPDNDRVMVDGNFVQPTFPVMSDFADPNIEIVFPQNLMNRDTPQGLTYSLSFVLPAGSPVLVDYKYGILRSAGSLSNTNIDNEADFAQNHTRYIRTSATATTYEFPLDIFGLQRTNPAGAIEPLFGKLAIGGVSGGNFPISWLGIRGVHLQSSTNLTSSVWQDVSNTDGSSSSSQPTTSGSKFFRLVKP